jgi:phage terminase large subunit
VNNAGKPRQEEDFINIRIESWVNVRDWLRDAILEKHEGFYQLAHPKYKITSNGKMQLESKEDMKKRGVKSPDVGDALALTLSKATEGANLGVTWL